VNENGKHWTSTPLTGISASIILPFSSSEHGVKMKMGRECADEKVEKRRILILMRLRNE
jgi:hypothetical protein